MIRQLASDVNLVELAELRRLEDGSPPYSSGHVHVLSDGTRHSCDRSECGEKTLNGARVATLSPASMVMAAPAISEHLVRG
eukprot:scaffold22644_cov99-Phaeocystis_antarctica.AAC.3